ncbi:MAG: D-alanyl-D-alanine carboxypeptidase family protein [Ruminococcaceae bacterium]|nr:D-alanyl-D-alanine carboxypeptidase family protein [Oscillospiraceae bacterium]
MAKKAEGYGFNVSGAGPYRGNTNNGGASRNNVPRRAPDVRAPRGRGSSETYRPDGARVGGAHSANVYRTPYGNGNVRPSGALSSQPRAVRSPDMVQRERKPSPQRANAQGAYRGTGVYEPQNRNARRIDMTEEQRVRYENAYRAKHGHSPYVGAQNAPYAERPQTPVREDRRQVFLREEAERLHREAEAARAEEIRLREAQAAARREAEKERRRREAAERRAAEERVREAEKKRLEIERRRIYEQNKRKYERARRAEEEKVRAERRQRLEKKLRRRRFVRSVAFHLRVVLATFLVTSMIIASACYFHFWTDAKPFSKSVTYLYGEEKVSGIDGDISYCDGIMCVDFIRVADMLGFYTVGDSSRVKFIVPDEVSPQYITVVPGSCYVEINGAPLTVSVPSRYVGSSLLVSSEIMSCFEKGVSFECENAKSASIQKVISRDEEGKALRDSDGELIYDKVVLAYKGQQTLSAPDLSVIYGDESLGIGIGTTVTFNTDLEEFEYYMNPSDSTAYLVLANKQNLLASDYIPEGLSDVAGAENIQLCLYAAKALEAMFIEMKDAGYGDVKAFEGYVGYETQVDEFNRLIAEEMATGLGENDAMRQVLSYFSAPGTNEHQTGLAVDIHNLPEADVSFADEEAFLWLKDNAWKFGYILRYPEGKDGETGHSFEPWHYRYVGRYAAEKIYKNGITLEEYLKGGR